MKLTDQELVRLANSIQELLYNASDICHDRSVKFLMARAKVRHLGQTVAGVSSFMRVFSPVTHLMSEKLHSRLKLSNCAASTCLMLMSRAHKH